MATEMKKQATGEELLKQAEAIIEKSVKYIAEMQPQLDKVAAEKVAYQSAVASTVKTLIERGLITPTESDQLSAKLAANPVMGLKLAERLAAQVGADSLGKKASDVKPATGRKLDAFERLVLTGDSAETNTNPCMIE